MNERDGEQEQEQPVNNPHDAVFRSAFRDREVAESFFRHYLPENIVRHIDFALLEITDGSYVDEKLKDKHADIVYKTRIKDATAFLYVLFEHQSAPDPMMAFRLLCYMVNLWKAYLDQHPAERQLPFIIPMVLYHGARKWDSPEHFREMFAENADFSVFIPNFTYHLFDLSKYQDHMLMIGDSMALAAVLHMFKHIFDADFHQHASHALKVLSQVRDRPKLLKFLEILLRYVYHARNDDRETVREYIDQGLQHFNDEKIMEAAMTVAEQIKQEGRQEGLQAGRQEGITFLIQKLINKRFGNVPPRLKQKLLQSDLDILDKFGESIFDFKDLKDAEKWWEVHGR